MCCMWPLCGFVTFLCPMLHRKNLFDKLMDDDEAAGFLRDKCFMLLVRYIKKIIVCVLKI